jgi:hypothetical protein
MAYVLGKKVVTDTEDFDSFAYGIRPSTSQSHQSSKNKKR